MIDDFFNKRIKNPEKLGAAPRIPNNKKYWTDLGKIGKKVMLYFHDDLDGVISAITMKNYLLSKDFEIIGYGVVNYQEGWDVVELNSKYINVAVDFAEITDGIDVYIDHHGEFKEDINLKGKFAIKTPTSSAYEGIMDQLGLPVDSIILDVIKMVDAAKYDDYDVEWVDLLNWDYDYFKQHKSPKLMFAGVFNQLLKRGDYRSFVEVVENATEPTIYQIYSLFKRFYPMNNLHWRFFKDYRESYPGCNEQTIWEDLNMDKLDKSLLVNKSGKQKQMFADFLEDGIDRVKQAVSKTSGYSEYKYVITGQTQFLDELTEVKSYAETSRSKFAGQSATVIKMDGYAIIGKLAYIPPGTWANAIRARAIIENDINSGRLVGVKKEDILWVLLQYGDTLQVCSFGDIDSYTTTMLPKNESGRIDDLKIYCKEIFERFQNQMGFINDDTLSGGHKGIGTISNIGVGTFKNKSQNTVLNQFNGLRYLDLFKNYMIRDFSEVSWGLTLSWKNPFSPQKADEPVPLNARVMMPNQIRIFNKDTMEIEYPINYKHKPNLGDLKRKVAVLKAQVEQLERQRIEQSKDRALTKHEFYATRKKGDNTTFEEWEKEKV